MMEALIKDFRQTVEEFSERLLSIPESESETPKAPGKWSPKEIIGHLIDSASNNHQRFVRAQFGEDLVFPGYDQEAWVRVQRYGLEPWPQLVLLWKSFNLHLCHVMAQIPEGVLKKPRPEHNLNEIAWKTISKQEPATLEYFMHDYIDHLRNHLRQILGES